MPPARMCHQVPNHKARRLHQAASAAVRQMLETTTHNFRCTQAAAESLSELLWVYSARKRGRSGQCLPVRRAPLQVDLHALGDRKRLSHQVRRAIARIRAW
jgi:hypothetical protein